LQNYSGTLCIWCCRLNDVCIGRKPFRLLFPNLAPTRIISFDFAGAVRATHFITNSYLFKGQFQPWNRHRTGSRRCKTNTFVIQEPSGRLIIDALSHLNYTAERQRVVNCCAVVKIALGLLIATDLIYNMQYQLSHLKYMDASKWINVQAIYSTRETSRLPNCLNIICSQSEHKASGKMRN
jgi:hypothetical protein